MAKIKILIADNSFLIREGFRSIINSIKEFKLIGEVEKAEDIAEKILLYQPDVLVIDYTSPGFCINDLLTIRQKFSAINVLAITNPESKETISQAIEYGVISYLLKDCSKEEIIEAIQNTANGQKFFCGKVLDTMLKDKDASATPISEKTAESVSCDGVKLSSREVEIIQLVTEGMSNKEIAERIFLSVHTVTTHRKNIMSKLGVNNTAGLVMFAIRQNLIEPNKFLFASN